MDKFFVLIIILAHSLGYYKYIKSTVGGVTSPNRTTWGIFSLLTGLELATYWVGNHRSVLKTALPVVDFLGAMVVFSATIWRGKFEKMTKTELAVVACQLVGIISWRWLGAMNSNLLLQIAVILAFVPTWAEAKGEDPAPWFLWALGGYGVELLVVSLNLNNWKEVAYPVVNLLCHLAVGVIALRKKSSNLYETEWSPADYLKEYYSDGITGEDAATVLFVIEFLREKAQKFDRMVEFGCGPTIHNVSPFLPYVGRVYMAEFLASNRKEVGKVLQGEGHDWSVYLSQILAFEGKTSEAEIEARMQMFRAKIAGLLPCNALKRNPLGNQRTFPLVSSFFCLECIQQEKEVWRQAMRNLSSLVAPGGWLILSALRNADRYMVCGREFPATHINEKDMLGALIACGFNPKTINVKVCPCDERAEEGFSSIVVASAQKY